jgi:hypothetical protein
LTKNHIFVLVSYMLRDGQIQLLPAQISDLAGAGAYLFLTCFVAGRSSSSRPRFLIWLGLSVFVSYLLCGGQIQLLPAQISDLAGLERTCFLLAS